MFDRSNTDPKGHASSPADLVGTCVQSVTSVTGLTASMPVTTIMVSEAPNVTLFSQHMTVSVRLIRSSIRVVVKITSTVSGSIPSIPNTSPSPCGPGHRRLPGQSQTWGRKASLGARGGAAAQPPTGAWRAALPGAMAGQHISRRYVAAAG